MCNHAPYFLCNPGTFKIKTNSTYIYKDFYYCLNCLQKFYFSYCPTCQFWFDSEFEGDGDTCLLCRG